MKVVIVGGTGNISTSITALLLNQGHEVTHFNRGQSGKPGPDVRVIQGDRGDEGAFEAAMQAGKFDAAIDMICFNAQQAASSLRAFRGVSHFVQCSTVCTYGAEFRWFPVNEDHELRPTTGYGRNKVAADNIFLTAYHGEAFPVTVIKPSTTFGPKMGLLRQIAWENTWVDRVRKGKPIVVCGDGNALHQFLHVDDAAPAFCNVLGRERCLGQVYNMTKRGFITWADYHRTTMKVIGREVELVGVTLADLRKSNVPNFGLCDDIFSNHCYYDSEKLFRDVPEFQPNISLEDGFGRTLEAISAAGGIPNSDDETWEDELIARQRAAHPAQATSG